MVLKIEMKTRERGGEGVWESKNRLTEREVGRTEKYAISFLKCLWRHQRLIFQLFHTQSAFISSSLYPLFSLFTFFFFFFSSSVAVYDQTSLKVHFSHCPHRISVYSALANYVHLCVPIPEKGVHALMLSWRAPPWSACTDRSCSTDPKPLIPPPVQTKISCPRPLLMSFFSSYMVTTISFSRGWWPGGDITWKQTCCVPSLMF